MKLFCLISALLATTSSALAAPYAFSTGTPSNQLAAASRPGSAFKEAADDFVLPLQTTLTSATFTGLLPSGAAGSSISWVAVEIYRVFPLDSTDPAPPGSPTRTNSPSDAAYEARDTTTDSLSVSFTLLNPSFTALNSVLNGINPAPNNLTGGEGPVSGAEGLLTATFIPAITLPEGHYFLRRAGSTLQRRFLLALRIASHRVARHPVRIGPAGLDPQREPCAELVAHRH